MECTFFFPWVSTKYFQMDRTGIVGGRECPCPRCGGDGKLFTYSDEWMGEGTTTCPFCRGSGTVTEAILKSRGNSAPKGSLVGACQLSYSPAVVRGVVCCVGFCVEFRRAGRHPTTQPSISVPSQGIVCVREHHFVSQYLRHTTFRLGIVCVVDRRGGAIAWLDTATLHPVEPLSCQTARAARQQCRGLPRGKACNIHFGPTADNGALCKLPVRRPSAKSSRSCWSRLMARHPAYGRSRRLCRSVWSCVHRWLPIPRRVPS